MRKAERAIPSINVPAAVLSLKNYDLILKNWWLSDRQSFMGNHSKSMTAPLWSAPESLTFQSLTLFSECSALFPQNTLMVSEFQDIWSKLMELFCLKKETIKFNTRKDIIIHVIFKINYKEKLLQTFWDYCWAPPSQHFIYPIVVCIQ